MREWGVAAVFAGQALGVWLAAGVERGPERGDFARIPPRLGDWTLLSEDGEKAMVERVSRADEVVARYYSDGRTGLVGHVLVAWYRSQREGARQPHQPGMCLAGAGWSTADEGWVEAGPLRARRVRAVRREESSEVVYWYQTRRRAVGGEWEAKWWVAVDGARDRRTDGALVRVAVAAGRGGEAREAARRLAAGLYAEVTRLWPR